MFNEKYKKESPILGMMGMGGGVGSNLIGGVSKVVATGGTKTELGDGYTYHIFTSPGTLVVENAGPGDREFTYLVVAGGGGGGGDGNSGGGGAGGVRTNLSGHPLSTNNPSITVTAATYTVTVGSGGLGSNGTVRCPPRDQDAGCDGNPSYFGPPNPSNGITALGGGGGARYNGPGFAGGSGGGSGVNGEPAPQAKSGGSGSFSGSPSNPQPYRQGYPGGSSVGNASFRTGGGGGGAGQAGYSGDHPSLAGNGGHGVQVLIQGPGPQPRGTSGPSPLGGYYGGGGSAGAGFSGQDRDTQGGYGGGGSSIYPSGAGPNNNHGQPGTSGTGGGGAAGGDGGTTRHGGSGGPGIVIIAYYQ